MLQLQTKTEYSFRSAFGKIEDIVNASDVEAIGIADPGTWGFVRFQKECKKAGKKPIYGFSFELVDHIKHERNIGSECSIYAKNLNGLKSLFRLCSLSNEQFYWRNRLTYEDLINYNNDNIIIIAGDGTDLHKVTHLNNLWCSVHPSNTDVWINYCKHFDVNIVAVSNMYYPKPEDEEVYDIFISDYKKTGAQFLVSEDRFKIEVPGWQQEWFDNTYAISNLIEEFELPKATNVKFHSEKTLEELCREGIKDRKMEWTHEYEDRLLRELNMISEKKFEDYFFVLSDLIKYAKRNMLVGPARGSSAGSLVCYLIDIVDVDPLKFGLIFERFIDINREDLPDIDVDFPDTRRQTVINYIKKKYGENCTAHIGTISEYKPKSALGEFGAKMAIPFLEMEDLKNTILERSGGDARAAMCIKDTFETTDLGKDMIDKYPQLNITGRIEGHARHHGKHAAGIIVLNDDIRNYCSVNRDGVAMIDKKDAEDLNILKIDALGLRTLSVIDACLKQIHMNRKKLLEIPLDDEKAFGIFNKGYFSGIFQFEGYALQSLNRQMPVESFDDIVAITTLARPGPLHSGGATVFINRRTGAEPVTYLHELAKECTEETFGVIIYQEQVMQVGRAIGNLSWEDVSSLRKAMSKSLGEEFFNKYWEKFKKGAKENGIDEKDAKAIWESMCTFGSWAFNKSHAVSYGMISYWCAWLKAHYPLEFAVSCLNNSKDEDQTIKILRELVKEGLEYVPFDIEKSGIEWTVQKGILYGGLTGIVGIGPKTAQDIIKRKKEGIDLLPGQKNKLDTPKIPYMDVFECQTKFGDAYEDPEVIGVTSGIPISKLEEIGNHDGTYLFIGKLKEKNLRDLNEYGNLVKRNMEIMEKDNLFLNLVFEDDTDKMICTIGTSNYEQFGKPIVEHGKINDFFLIKGVIRNEWRKIYINNIKLLESTS